MGIILSYILLFTSTLVTIISIALEDGYAINGIVGIVFTSSCILRSKFEKRSLSVNLAFWTSSIIIVFSFVLKQFL